jgi:hypothetical protein
LVIFFSHIWGYFPKPVATSTPNPRLKTGAKFAGEHTRPRVSRSAPSPNASCFSCTLYRSSFGGDHFVRRGSECGQKRSRAARRMDMAQPATECLEFELARLKGSSLFSVECRSQLGLFSSATSATLREP